jgi:hypothetical protein
VGRSEHHDKCLEGGDYYRRGRYNGARLLFCRGRGERGGIKGTWRLRKEEKRKGTRNRREEREDVFSMENEKQSTVPF